MLLYLACSKLHWPPRARTIFGLLDGLIEASPEGTIRRVVDIGCGPGLLWSGVHARKLAYLGVDTNANAVSFCKTVYVDPAAVFACLDLKETISLLRAGDVVVMNGLLHHLDASHLGAVRSYLEAAQAVILADHLFSARTPVWPVRFLQRLDRGKNVRSQEELARLFQVEPTHFLEYPIPSKGPRLWDYFTAVYAGGKKAGR